ncbi:MAG: hypothetical protein AAGU75_02545 [Bacillota bacterium]
MFWFYLPVFIIVAANVTYDTSSKSIPEDINAYASITISYLVLAVFNFIIFVVLNPTASLFSEIRYVNWAVIFFALASIGLESGYIFLYRAGWNISVGGLVCNILLAINMVLIGHLFYNEFISMRQIFGIILCVAGLIYINRTEFIKAQTPLDPELK